MIEGPSSGSDHSTNTEKVATDNVPQQTSFLLGWRVRRALIPIHCVCGASEDRGGTFLAPSQAKYVTFQVRMTLCPPGGLQMPRIEEDDCEMYSVVITACLSEGQNCQLRFQQYIAPHLTAVPKPLRGRHLPRFSGDAQDIPLHRHALACIR